ncbi:bifunctional proline dehydrogenase/L-glutamate gamma-semialdehyde dehydrogenase PutA [Wolbachia endosymbiont of Howardula sp.]|uniref:bifunctional proline dehydrogenase/L-glutamate gamma-semialdehyde dehydrogenase PutA n=1 Tax=Wolbachia endosymbiont of Howardula sp. TaxID=2916816 RepID=UPI00217E81B9|nr:bifunctional proline dehydrogenase/L-glutamate gamma-semialdehyde dehydrogenase PutA [Wolbachia endosymbiont of Howardula sp.]UWI83088.1 bifunctional proline dehydrogenase/L-glutamate gamma-semialdehyde dehydrogenase PutA [Wolbachia endosymbiont of Howardula sp.]
MINSIQKPNELRKHLQGYYRIDEKSYIRYLVEKADISSDSKNRIYNIAKQVTEKIQGHKLKIVDSFMHQYSLSNDEGIALMCLAESLLRIPDDYTIDELIRDKIAHQEWSKYLGHSSSMFVNASTWSLVIGSSILRRNTGGDTKFYYLISRLLKNLGEPIIRKAVKQAVFMLSKHFILGETIEEALENIHSDQHNKFLSSFGMIGETVHTAEDAREYFNLYMHAIEVIGKSTNTNDCFKSHGLSIKLSLLHPNYQFNKFDCISNEMLGNMLEICHEAKKYNISLCIDAEESEKLEMSLILFEQLRLNTSLSKWEGLGFTVQAYQKRALSMINFIEDIAIRIQHKIMVRLVKGAYWDSEIKHTQALGLYGYPVFTRKSYTDVSYLACAQKLLSKTQHFYPCFGTHNAYTFATIIELADKHHPGFEFQRLYGMAKGLYDYAMSELATNINYRIYSPVGKHSDLLSYLIRRILSNGINNSFVHPVNDSHISIDELIDPLEKSRSFEFEPHTSIPLPQKIYGDNRKNSLGMDIHDSVTVSHFTNEIQILNNQKWQIGPIINGQLFFDNTYYTEIINPADLDHVLGEISYTTQEQAIQTLEIAYNAFTQWNHISPEDRAQYLEEAADLLEERKNILIYILIVEVGKVLSDAISEVRAAVDFLRQYAMIAKNQLKDWKKLPSITGEEHFTCFEGRGVFLCISPWNCPLAIFVSQISAALAAGNTVLAKPAKQTSLIAFEIIKILHESGIPNNVLHFIPGDGSVLGTVLLIDQRIAGVAFTGSLCTAQIINRILASREGAIIPLIASTRGMNAMIVDSSALLEQVTEDVIISSFCSAGQRYAALKVLFIQEDIADKQIKMICGAIQELKIGNPIEFSTDIGPMIDRESLEQLIQYTNSMSKDTNAYLISEAHMKCHIPNNGYFFSPYIYVIQNLSQIKQEIVGPILHIIRFHKSQLYEIISDINNIRYGLTFSLQSRIQNQIDIISKNVSVGNVYINCNQIGVGMSMHPFGGRGLSGTGPHVGGSHYIHRFSSEKVVSLNTTVFGSNTTLTSLN